VRGDDAHLGSRTHLPQDGRERLAVDTWLVRQHDTHDVHDTRAVATLSLGAERVLSISYAIYSRSGGRLCNPPNEGSFPSSIEPSRINRRLLDGR
jgi:hypothetical protein